MGKPHQYNTLQMAILAQLPRVNEEGEGEYLTAAGLQMDPDAHPLVKQASLASLRANLGVLTRTKAIIPMPGDKPRTRYRRGHKIADGAKAYAVQPVKRQ